MSIPNSQSNLIKSNSDKKVHKIKQAISKDIMKQETASSSNIKSIEKVNLKVPLVVKNESISVPNKINKLDKTPRVSSKDSINKNSDKSKSHAVHKDSSKTNDKSKNLVKQNSTDLKKVKNRSLLSSKITKDQKVSESEQRIVTSKLVNSKPVLKTTDKKISRIKKTAEVPVKRTVDYFKNDKKDSEKPKKVTPTNVTINSPVHKTHEKSINYDDSESLSSTSNTIFSDLQNKIFSETKNDLNDGLEENKSKKHQRFRTRTLESHEVKVMGNPENSEINTLAMKSLISGVSNVEKPLIKTPKAFYIPLEEKTVSKEIIENLKSAENSVDPEDTSISYDDDFESYESDFEACSSTESIRLDSRDDTNSDNSEIESDELALSKNGTKTIEIKEDEKHLDSGNYDLREVHSKTNSIRDDIIDGGNVLMHDYLKSADSARHVSYTDEGFDENSGGFSSTSILSRQEEQPMQGNIFDIGVQLFDKSMKPYKGKIIDDGKKLRVKELLSLITLDSVRYCLFDMSPIPYDIFMKTFGKSNSTQGSSQTNDDSIDEAIQTDFTDRKNKWTQFPVNFSDNEINVGNDNRNDTSTENYLNTIGTIGNPHRQSNIKYYDQMKFVKLSCPLQIYCKQRLGCSIDFSYSKEEIDKKIILSKKSLFSKTVRFMQSAGVLMINYLNEKCHSLDTNQTQKSDFPFSKRFNTILPHNFDIDYLKDRPPTILSFSDTGANCFLTVHPEKDFTSEILDTADIKKLFFSKTLICVWTSQSYTATTPVKILVAVENICSCGFNGNLAGMVISGSNNGALYAWDLNECDKGQILISKAIEDNLTLDNESNLNSPDDISSRRRNKVNEVILQGCSFSNVNLNTINTNTLWMGAIVDIIFLKSLITNNTSHEVKQKYNNQVSTLHQCGFLTIWTIINSALFKAEDVISRESYCSNLVLHKSNVIDLRKSFSLNNLQHSPSHISDSCSSGIRFQEFDLITAQRRNSLKKGDMAMIFENNGNLKNGLMKKIQPMKFDIDRTKYTLLGQEIKTENKGFLDIEPKKKLESNLYDTISTKHTMMDGDNTSRNFWDSIICLKVKHLIDKNGAGHFLVACNGGKIVHHLQKSLQKKSFLFSCGDNAVSTMSIEICPYEIPYFLVGCHDSTIHLYSLDSPQPIKNFISTNNIENFTYISNPKYSIKKEVRIMEEKKSLGNDIISVQWSKSKPCRFFAVSKNGRFIEWDLMKSDVTHKQSGCADSSSESLIRELKILPMFDGESGHKKEYMILQFGSGEIQVHLMEDEYNSSLQNYHQERKLLMKYLELF